MGGTSRTNHRIPDSVLADIKGKLGFSAADLHRFLERTEWESFHCEVCSQSSFKVSVIDERPIVFSMDVPGSPGTGYWVIAIHCEICGNVKLLNPTFVKDWLRNQSSGL